MSIRVGQALVEVYLVITGDMVTDMVTHARLLAKLFRRICSGCVDAWYVMRDRSQPNISSLLKSDYFTVDHRNAGRGEGERLSPPP